MFFKLKDKILLTDTQIKLTSIFTSDEHNRVKTNNLIYSLKFSSYSIY